MTIGRRLLIAIRQGAIMILIAALAAGFCSLRPDGLSWIKPYSPVTGKGTSLATAGITLDEAYRGHLRRNVLFLDARDAWSFDEGHLPGAWHVPPEKAGAFAGRIRKAREAGKVIITYCEGATCHLSSDLAAALEKLGIAPVKVFHDGWGQWQRAGYPVEK